MTRLVPVALLSAALIAPPASRSQEAACCDDGPCTPVPDAIRDITARELGGHMKFLASDLMRGRDTASDEIRLAAEYLATRLSALGAEPAGDPEREGRSYFQQFPLEYVTPKAEGTRLELVVEKDGARRVVPWTLFADFVAMPFGLSPGEVEGPVVFAGHGLVDAEAGIDDYDNLDVKNRFVLVLDGAPSPGPGGGRRPRANPMAKREEARRRGALGLISVRKPGVDVRPGQSTRAMAERMYNRPRMNLAGGGGSGSLPVITLDDPARDTLADAAGLDLASGDLKPRNLDGLRLRFAFAADKEVKHDRNVVGLFPGSDPEKKNEVVIFSAHYDHVGVDSKGDIFNGSDDNASGTSALLEIAEAFADGPRPARSVAFLWVSGEEKGLLGSAYFADHVPLPDGMTIVADINLDMVSRNDPKSVGITPSDKHADYSTLIPAAQAACRAEDLEAKFEADDYYGRTDSFNFARKGIPVIFFFSGEHEDYHKPTDEVAKADFDKAARIARAAYRLGWHVAQSSDAPKKIKADSLAGPDAKSPSESDAARKPEPARAEGTGSR